MLPKHPEETVEVEVVETPPPGHIIGHVTSYATASVQRAPGNEYLDEEKDEV